MKRDIDYSVYLVTDDPSRYERDFVEAVDEAVAGGVTLVQYRDTESSDRVMYERALRLAAMLRARHIPLIINNSPGLALAVNADGIHLGQSDLPADVVRRIVGETMILGLSVTCGADLATATACVDYVGIGPVYDATKTKADAAPEMGVDGFRALREKLAAFPAVAIGGITPDRAPGIIAAGADGLAIVSALSRTASPENAAREFARLFENAKK